MKRTKLEVIKKYLKPWTRAANYSGVDWSDYYMAIGRHRDSNILDNSNFDSFLALLGGENGGNVVVANSSHWAVGWVECILVHKQAPKRTLAVLTQTLESLDDYPIVDEDHYSNAENEEADETLKANAGDFLATIEKVAGYSCETQDDCAAGSELLAAIYEEDRGYRGTEEAWVSEQSIKRFMLNKYATAQLSEETRKTDLYCALCLRFAPEVIQTA
jgi:hypothetical protein